MKEEKEEFIAFAYQQSNHHLESIVESVKMLEEMGASSVTAATMIATITAALTSSYLKCKGSTEILADMITDNLKKRVEITVKELH